VPLTKDSKRGYVGKIKQMASDRGWKDDFGELVDGPPSWRLSWVLTRLSRSCFLQGKRKEILMTSSYGMY